MKVFLILRSSAAQRHHRESSLAAVEWCHVVSVSAWFTDRCHTHCLSSAWMCVCVCVCHHPPSTGGDVNVLPSTHPFCLLFSWYIALCFIIYRFVLLSNAICGSYCHFGSLSSVEIFQPISSLSCSCITNCSATSSAGFVDPLMRFRSGAGCWRWREHVCQCCTRNNSKLNAENMRIIYRHGHSWGLHLHNVCATDQRIFSLSQKTHTKSSRSRLKLDVFVIFAS